MQSSITTALFGPIERAHSGTQQASEWYQKKAHEFLGYFGIKDAETIGIYKLDWTLHPEYRLVPGLAMRSGIWLNESALEKLDESERLWVIAHETAHYTYNHAWRKIGVETACTVASSLSAALMGAAFVWRLKRYHELFTQPLWKNMLNGAAVGLIGGMYTISSYINARPALNSYAKTLEIQADLMAAKMLCTNGYTPTVQAHIQSLSDSIAKGAFVYNIQDHPSLEESLAYLQAFWTGFTEEINNAQK